MKMIITLQEFYDAVLAVAKERGSDYASVKIEMTTHSGIRLSGYYHKGVSWEEGLTIEEVCRKLRRIGPEKSPITDVEFETKAPESIEEKIDKGLAELKSVAAAIPEIKEPDPL